MKKIGFIFAGLVFALGTANAQLEGVDVPKTIPDEPIDIAAGRMEYSNTTFYASGGVTGRFENVTFSADHLSGNPDTGELFIEGDIHFERGKILWDGSSLNYNYLTQEGNFGPSTLEMDPVLLSVGQIERVSTNEYLLSEATFTTCHKDHPHYHVRVKEARLVDEKYLSAKGATFYIGKVPVFYLPFWKQTLSASVFTFRFGHGSEWGPYAKVRATLPLSAEMNSLTDVNIYTKRGIGLGQGFEWASPQSIGRVGAFYLADQDPHAKYDVDEIDAGRYRLNLEELYYVSDTHYVNTKWNYLSDPYVLKEFDRSEYRNSAQPENYASWVYGNRFLASEAFANYRMNSFYANTDRFELSGDLYRMRVGNSPIYFQSENSMAYLERVYSKTNLLDNVDSLRFDTANTFYMPKRVGFLNVIPRAGFRGTFYSKSAVDNGTEFRATPTAGMELSMQASKVLSDRARWYGTGLRHKIEPYVDYCYADASVETRRLYQFDAIDALGDENRSRIGLRNVLQTKRHNRISRLIDLDLYTFYLFDRNGASDDFDSLFVDARMPLTDRIVFDVDGEIDWNSGNVPFFNSRFSYRKNEDILLSIEHLYRRSEQQSLWTPRFDLYPDADLSLFGFARYDDKSGDIEEITLGGYGNRCCMRYGLGFHFYDDGEVSIMLSVGLSDFPEASISSGF